MSKILGIAFFVTVSVSLVFLIRRTTENPSAISPSAAYRTPLDEIANVEASAENGDCAAAYRIAKYYSSVALQSDLAIKWFRVAAKCPGAKAKAELIALLVDLQDQPGVTAEIHSLVGEIRTTDPELALRAAAQAEYSRTAIREYAKDR